MPVSFSAQWKEIKVDYEAATDKKKPSDKFLGVFKKSTGLDSLFKDMDTALKKEAVDDAKKAYEKLEKAADAYQKVLFKAAAAETNKDVQKDTKVMMVKLNDLIEESDMSWKSMATLPLVSTLRDYAKLMKTPAADRILAYAKKRYMEDQIKFLNAMLKKDFSVKTYKDFVKDNDINVPAKLIAQFKEDELKDAPWDEAIKEVLTVFRQNVLRELNSGLK